MKKDKISVPIPLCCNPECRCSYSHTYLNNNICMIFTDIYRLVKNPKSLFDLRRETIAYIQLIENPSDKLALLNIKSTEPIIRAFSRYILNLKNYCSYQC